MRVLIVEDDKALADGLLRTLRQSGYAADHAGNGELALRAFAEEHYDLIVLDISLPGIDGFEVLRQLRKHRQTGSILILTAHDAEADRVRGLDLGADDYVTKPFSLRELLARVRAVLRRPGPRQKFEEFAFGDVRIRLRGRQVFRAGREVRLTRKEFDLLVFLVEHRGEVVTRERLLDEVWGYERFPTTRTVDTHILRLRRKFEADPDRPAWILTVHGQGYKFAAV